MKMYIVAVKTFENKIFQFKTKEQRKHFINALKNYNANTEYATSECYIRK